MPDSPSPYDLRPIVIEAIAIHGGQRDRSFESGDFAVAVTRYFDTKRVPDGGWCNDVLSRLDYVKPIGDGRTWRAVREDQRARTSRPTGKWNAWGLMP